MRLAGTDVVYLCAHVYVYEYVCDNSRADAARGMLLKNNSSKQLTPSCCLRPVHLLLLGPHPVMSVINIAAHELAEHIQGYICEGIDLMLPNILASVHRVLGPLAAHFLIRK